MPNIQYAVVYNFERTATLRQDGTATVYVRAYLDGKNRYFNTGISVTPKQWHTKNKTIVHHPNQFQLNKSIRDTINKMQRFEYQVKETGQAMTLDRLQDYENHKHVVFFSEFIQDRLSKEKSRLSKGTYIDQKQTVSKLDEFKKEIAFHELKPKLVKDFIDFLHDQGLSQNTVHKHYKNLRKFINLAVKYEYLKPEKNPTKRITVKTEPTDRLFLMEHEFQQFEAFEVPADKPHFQQVKDLFLFSCMTGLRFSDVSNLTQENVYETPEGIELSFISQKTGKRYRQNLRKLFPEAGKKYSRPEQIIKRRLEKLFIPDERLFVYRSSQPYVRQLKLMASQLPVRPILKRGISSHTGRHTFGTIMAGKIDIHVLKALMQHSNIRETMIYVHLNKQMIDRALDRVKW